MRPKPVVACGLDGVLCDALGPLLDWIGARTPLLGTAQSVLLLSILLLRMHQAQYSALISTENRYPFAFQILLTGCVAMLVSISLAPKFGIWGILAGAGIAPACYVNWAVVRRAVSGLGCRPVDYWLGFLGFRKAGTKGADGC